MKQKLFFFGIDSATWDLIKPWVKAGKLPGFAKLLSGGTTFNLQSTIPPITPVAWPTAMTGACPAQHGFYDFYRLDKSHQITVNLAMDLKYPFFWDYLSRAGKKVGIFNVPITYPFKPVNGIMISGLMTPNTKADFIAPHSLKKEFLRRFPNFRFAPQIKVSKNDSDSYRLRLQENLEDAKETVKIAKWLFKKDRWDLFAVNFMAIDHVQHFYWEFMNQPNSPYKRAILSVYQVVDNYLEEVLEKCSREFQIMIFSDHGAGPLEQTLFLNHWLLQKGYLQFKKSPKVLIKRLATSIGITPQNLTNIASKLKLVREAGRVDMQTRNRLLNKLVLSYADLDWNKTRAYSFGMYGGIFLTHKNKALVQKIMAELKDDFGKQLTFLSSSDKIYGQPTYPQTIPDIQFMFKDGAIVSTNIYAFAGRRLFTDPITNKSGEHRINGILGFYPKVLTEQANPTLLNITPTILDFFRLPIPDYCTGASLLPVQEKSAIDQVKV